MEVFRGRVDFDDIRLSAGHKWIIGGRIFVGDATSPLQPGQLAQIQPGMLIRIVPRGGRPPVRCASFDTKLACPQRWFRTDAEVVDADDAEPARHIGLLGVMGDWITLPAGPLRDPACLCNALEEHCGRPATDFHFLAPSVHTPNVYFRGDFVPSILAIIPRAVSGYCALYLDARDLLIPLTVLVLPPIATSLTKVLQLAGGERPSQVTLRVSGVDGYDPGTEAFVPQHKAVMRVSVCESDAWFEGVSSPTPASHFAEIVGLADAAPCTRDSAPGNTTSPMIEVPRPRQSGRGPVQTEMHKRLLAPEGMVTGAGIAKGPALITSPIVSLVDPARVLEQSPPVIAPQPGEVHGHLPSGSEDAEGEESEGEVPSCTLGVCLYAS